MRCTVEGVMKQTILIAMALVVLATAMAEAQQRPSRPSWPDVCCGGPCCQKPQRPGR
jgi:hypothetical protein